MEAVTCCSVVLHLRRSKDVMVGPLGLCCTNVWSGISRRRGAVLPDPLQHLMLDAAAAVRHPAVQYSNV